MLTNLNIKLFSLPRTRRLAESPECSVASSTKRDALLSNANSLNRECLTIRIDETTKEYEQWNQHAQHTKLRFYVDSAQRRAHKGDESFYMQVEDGCVELRDRRRKAIQEVKKKERVKLLPGMSIKFHDAGELRVMRNVSAHA